MKRYRFIILFLFCIFNANMLDAQELTQTIRGNVNDMVSNQPLFAATIAIYDDSTMISAAVTDDKGMFRIEKLPVGRYTVVTSYVGYRSVVLPDQIVNSAREIVLSVKMEELPVEIGEVQVRGTGQKGNAMNKLAFVSARTFSVEESERYAGSRGDPARMASNFAGVQGNDDSNNDLIIRGNSPLGVLWRLEGINIPNPNHFGVSGTTGGPVTILNNKVLSVSDFLTGAFPAEFGNGIAGVFDLKMRNGNNEKHEYSAQLGFLGTELLAEGPVNRNHHSSYLLAYRYSTLSIFKSLGIQIGTDAIPKYEDLSFRLNFPFKNQGNLAVFGIGGNSAIDILASEQDQPGDEIYGFEAMDEHFRTGVGVVGVKYTKSLGTQSLLNLTAASSFEHQSNHLDKVYREVVNNRYVIDSIMFSHNGFHNNQFKQSLIANLDKKLSRKVTLKTGLVLDLYTFDMLDSIFNDVLERHVIRLNYKGPALLSQPYAQVKLNSSENLSLTAGIHGLFLNLENNLSKSVEPRFGLKYRISTQHYLGYGFGLHSQMLPSYIYFSRVTHDDGSSSIPNAGLDLIKSIHNVLTWDYSLNPYLRIKTEAYYQHLYNVPVEAVPSSYSSLDEGHDLSRFFPDSLVNTGTGRNMGMEFTLEKFFHKSYFLLFTASLYDARRTGSDGKLYNAVFNGRYIFNALGSKVFSWGDKSRSTLTLGGKLTMAGGKRYTPIDLNASQIAGEAVYFDKQRNSMQFSDYFRADVKLNYSLNTRKVTHEIGLDIVNVTNHRNILKQTYVPGSNDPVREKYQLGMLPLFYYRLDF
ncbi:carboxypeptidase regulatory-like domain-containing protein [Saccharicrinis sp. FJH54]|uniref:carboxypeptidase regulatory-like domain-containing protein n=1 Tax=Saccharicrinis sp. FJH54 TaxID=3344665 RepID=UPI0035D465CA